MAAPEPEFEAVPAGPVADGGQITGAAEHHQDPRAGSHTRLNLGKEAIEIAKVLTGEERPAGRIGRLCSLARGGQPDANGCAGRNRHQPGAKQTLQVDRHVVMITAQPLKKAREIEASLEPIPANGAAIKRNNLVQVRMV